MRYSLICQIIEKCRFTGPGPKFPYHRPLTLSLFVRTAHTLLLGAGSACLLELLVVLLVNM
jgi:hypothetical protein